MESQNEDGTAERAQTLRLYTLIAATQGFTKNPVVVGRARKCAHRHSGSLGTHAAITKNKGSRNKLKGTVTFGKAKFKSV